MTRKEPTTAPTTKSVDRITGPRLNRKGERGSFSADYVCARAGPVGSAAARGLRPAAAHRPGYHKRPRARGGARSGALFGTVRKFLWSDPGVRVRHRTD